MEFRRVLFRSCARSPLAHLVLMSLRQTDGTRLTVNRLTCCASLASAMSTQRAASPVRERWGTSSCIRAPPMRGPTRRYRGADRQHDQTLAGPTFNLQIQCWEAFIDSTEGRAQRIAVPYQPVPIPGYLFRPDTSDAPRPTLVMTNGGEGSLSGLWTW